ncbi:MAG: cell division protein FtsA [Holophagaceae bacterium]|nr:cell division protein FtsA [Holophagaceae bacterium]
MMQQSVLLGIDLGASKISAVVAVREQEDTTALRVTGASLTNQPTGIRQGQITDINSTVEAIRRVVEEALRTAGQIRPDGVLVTVDGIQFKGENLRDTVTISSLDRVITIHDRDRVMEQATNTCKLTKEETVLHKNPQWFHIKGQRDIKNPINMIGDTLEAEVRIIIAPASVLENINRALHLSELQSPRLCYSPIASAQAVLSREDAENGAVVVDIGDQLTHIGVFMSGSLFHSAVIAIGGSHFTRDIEAMKHLGGIKVAERIKRLYGTVLPSGVPAEEMIELEDEGRQVSRRELAEVLQSRAVELLNMVLAEIGRSGIMHEIHGGVHLVGGGALLPHLPILAQHLLGRPRVVLGKVSGLHGLPQIVANPFFTNALGAVKVLSEDLNETFFQPGKPNGIIDWVKGLF